MLLAPPGLPSFCTLPVDIKRSRGVIAQPIACMQWPPRAAAHPQRLRLALQLRNKGSTPGTLPLVAPYTTLHACISQGPYIGC